LPQRSIKGIATHKYIYPVEVASKTTGPTRIRIAE